MTGGDLIEILQITGAFGIRGFLRALLYSDTIKKYKTICDASGKEYGFRVVRFISGNSVVLSLDGVADRNTAESLRGTSLFVKKTDLPKLSSSEFYISDLIGKTVRVQGREEICTIVSVCNYGAGDLVELSYNEIAFLVLFTKENFPESDDGSLIITAEAFDWYKD
ncbi:ribosome maturation factor RimM [Alphaproteobacteria bacterium]|nr:ribosome maturation factor RimM [Alphaproteobacteria bacterium]